MEEIYKIEIPELPSRTSPDYLKKAAEATQRMQDLTARLQSSRSEIGKNLKDKAA